LAIEGTFGDRGGRLAIEGTFGDRGARWAAARRYLALIEVCSEVHVQHAVASFIEIGGIFKNL